VGQPTAGLAGIQHLIRLPDGYGLMMTTERYLQIDGTPIHGRGLRPDVLVDIPVTGFDEPAPATDAVLDRGVKELRSPSPASSPNASPAPSRGTSTAPPTAPGPRPSPQALPPSPQ
jgi:C-terminal processing protease CtpA/Prc